MITNKLRVEILRKAKNEFMNRPYMTSMSEQLRRSAKYHIPAVYRDKIGYDFDHNGFISFLFPVIDDFTASNVLKHKNIYAVSHFYDYEAVNQKDEVIGEYYKCCCRIFNDLIRYYNERVKRDVDYARKQRFDRMKQQNVCNVFEALYDRNIGRYGIPDPDHFMTLYGFKKYGKKWK